MIVSSSSELGPMVTMILVRRDMYPQGTDVHGGRRGFAKPPEHCEGSPHLGDLDPDSHRTRFIVPKARKSVYRLQRADHTSTPPQRLTSVASARFTTPIVCAVELIFVRHGLPLHVVKDDGSPADPPLSDLGNQQAAAVAEYLSDEHLDAIYVSTMARARQTAAPLEDALGLTAAIRHGIAEIDRNSASYIPMEELKRIDYERWKSFIADGGPQEEDPAEFQDLVKETVTEIVEDHRGQRVAVVCHGGVINAYASDVLGHDRGDIFFCDVDYTSITRVLVASTGQRSILSLNETSHIRHLPHPRHT